MLLLLSLSQHRICAGSHNLSSCLQLSPTPDGLSFRDLRLDDQGLLQPETTAVSQFSFSLVKAVHVGPSGKQDALLPCFSVA
jgi:hypothetical protein